MIETTLSGCNYVVTIRLATGVVAGEGVGLTAQTANLEACLNAVDAGHHEAACGNIHYLSTYSEKVVRDAAARAKSKAAA